ncbi:MAG: hypothetical protein HYT42_00340, partial [Candidatus Sungbacteria bacterium]|nr:hypothetical protein [Candidatus Sungbacteria bacterium]
MMKRKSVSPSRERSAVRKDLKPGVSWGTMKSLSWRQWLYLPRLFSREERTRILVIGAVALVALYILSGRITRRVTILRPAVGGVLREGVIREPRFINPIFASNDTDRDITSLVFSKLIRYDQNGVPVMDLAEKVEVSPDGRGYTLHLRRGVTWHDGENFSADDVVFTIKTIQDPEYKSPLRQNWQGVAVEKLDDWTMRLVLRQAYAPFFENLSLGIIPEHLWRKIPREAAVLSDLNLKPIGTGPYRFNKLVRRSDGSIISINLLYNKKYYLDGPFIKEVVFSTYSDEEEMVAAYRRNEIDSLFLTSAASAAELKSLDTELYRLNLSKVFAVFLNPGANSVLGRKPIRQALQAAIDREALLEKAAESGGVVINSAIPPGTFGFNPAIEPPKYNPEESRKLLKNDGWKDSDGDGVLDRIEGRGRNRKTEKLEIRLATSDSPELAKAAELIAEMWQAVGIKTEVKTLPISELEAAMIRPRAYEALLFGEVFGHDPDPFAFWHTSQLKNPGLNIALYSNRAVDSLLEDARNTGDEILRKSKYGEFQKLVANDIGAIFLYSPSDYYAVRRNVKGVALGAVTIPDERFSGINQ